MDSPKSLALDSSSADASLEHAFFERGLRAERELTSRGARLDEAGPDITDVTSWKVGDRWEEARRGAFALTLGVGSLAVIGLALAQGQRPGELRAQAATPALAMRRVAPPSTTLAQVQVAAPEGATGTADSCRLAARRRSPSTRDLCTLALARQPDSAELTAELAGYELTEGRAQQALELARRAVQLSPSLPDAYLVIGAAEQSAGRTEPARVAYRKYLELAPQGPRATELRAVLADM